MNFPVNFHVSRRYFPFLRSIKMKFQQRTSAEMVIPQGDDEGPIVVKSSENLDKEWVVEQIREEIQNARKRFMCTHFLGFPLNGKNYQERFLDFKNGILTNCDNSDISEDLFTNPGKLHLTVAVFVITDEVEKSEVIDTFKNCKETVISPILKDHPFSVKIQGIHCMENDPKRTKVLYADVTTPQEPNLLQDLVNKINWYFVDRGLIGRPSEFKGDVKIHSTLMKTRAPSRRGKRKTFDATDILKMYGDFNFGEEVISQLDLSVMSSTDNNGYYSSLLSVGL